MSEQNQSLVRSVSSQDSILTIIDRAARDPSIDVSKMERLLALAEQVHARTAKAEYDQAMNAAQSEMRPISRDCHNPQTRSKYASYEAIDTAIRPIYTAHGFAMSFGSKAAVTPDHVIVTCRISHRAGHTENVDLDMPADGKGARGNDVMTKTHATGSALSYGKRYIANLVWNLSFGESDDDGNAAGRTARPPATQQNAPQAKPEPTARPKATTADVTPKAATEQTRAWMLKELEPYGEDCVLAYARDKAILLPTEALTDWPLAQVPTSKEALRELQWNIEEWRTAQSGGPPAEDEAWRSIGTPFEVTGTPKGTPFGDLPKNKLWWWCMKWEPRPYKGQISAKDQELRAVLDEVKNQYAFNEDSKED